MFGVNISKSYIRFRRVRVSVEEDEVSAVVDEDAEAEPCISSEMAKEEEAVSACAVRLTLCATRSEMGLSRASVSRFSHDDRTNESSLHS